MDANSDNLCSRCHGQTALHIALSHNNPMLVVLLLNSKSAMMKDNRAQTPLHLVANSRHMQASILARLLIDANAVVSAQDEHGQTPLHIAAEVNNISLVKLLLEEHADLISQNKRGETPLHVAVQSRRDAAAKLLLEAGSDVSAQDKSGLDRFAYGVVCILQLRCHIHVAGSRLGYLR